MLFLRQNTAFLRLFIVMLLSGITANINLGSNLPLPTSVKLNHNLTSTLKELNLNGCFHFHDIHYAAKDFGNYHHYLPLAILQPKTVSDIAMTIKHVFQMGLRSNLTVAARGHGHSLQGQAQAPDGLVIDMETLEGPELRIHTGKVPYIDAPGGELWINVLQESLKYGLAPKSWTDYLHLTVGGTLSNAGISGQAFRHGPQISNVHQLEIVTGRLMHICMQEKRNYRV